MLGDELFENVVGVASALDAFDLQRFVQVAAQGCGYFDSHGFIPLCGFRLHMSVRIALKP